MKYIIITQRIDIIKSYNEKRDCLDIQWTNLIIKCGFLPLIVPNNIYAVKLILKNSNNINGIILTGGNDLYKYGGNALERDKVEYYLLEYAIDNNIPLLGICRGMQIIQDYYNIKLYKIDGHVGTKHSIVYKNNSYILNSYHNYGAIESSKEVETIIKSKDNIIEVIKHKEYDIYGMMHHPERNKPFNLKDLEFIKRVMRKKEVE